MSAYVVKSWDVNTEVNQQGNFVEIKGRAPGLVSWILALMGIEPTVSISISDELFTFEAGSWSGRFYKTIPLSKISSVYYGYSKPWKKAIFIAVLFTFFLNFGWWIGAIAGSQALIILGTFMWGLLSIIGALVYYFLNNVLTLGVFEIGGGATGIEIKRSVIEGKKLDEKDAEKVGDLIQQLLITKNR